MKRFEAFIPFLMVLLEQLGYRCKWATLSLKQAISLSNGIRLKMRNTSSSFDGFANSIRRYNNFLILTY